jgi:site-specific DNA-methyltransferase (adenine-specific)
MINLINGDCFEEMPKLEAQSVDMVVTSPPYNRKRNDKYNNHNDAKSDYVSFLENSINECLRVCSGNVFFNIQKNTYNREDVHKIIGMFAEQIIEVIIWNKSNPMPNPHLINAYEYILVLSANNKSLKANKTYTKNQFTTPVYSANPYKEIHRAVMHPEAAKYMITNFSSEGQTILDPFMGVGTTGIVCNELNRSFTGIELDKDYFDICKNKLN